MKIGPHEVHAKIDALASELAEEACVRYNGLLEKPRVVSCVFCGEAYPDGTPESQDERLAAHIKVCPKHPLTTAIKTLQHIELIAGEAMSNGGHEVQALAEIRSIADDSSLRSS